MPPRKNIENARVKPLQVKAVKGVRKKTISATAPVRRRLKVTPKSDMCATVTEDQITSNSSPKIVQRPRLRKKKIGLNAGDALPVVNIESNVLSPKARAKANKNNIKTSPDDESTVNKPDSPVMSPRSKGKSNLRHPSNEIKIMLANEVIRNAFQKKPVEPVATIEISTGSCEDLLKSKRGRPKKATVKLLDYVVNCKLEPTKALENNEQIQDVAKKKLVRNGGKKRSITVEAPSGDSQTQSNLTNDSNTEEVPKKRKRLSLKRKVIPKTPAEPKTRKAISDKKSKDENSETVNPEINTSVSPQTNGHVSEKANASERKNSITSTSTCFSWTKDISSSSAVTCVTVQSHDFVRIDEKLPIVKVVKLDRQLKDTNDNIFDDVSFASTSKRKASECSSTVSTVDLSNSNALNLSTSSLTSVATNKPSQDIVKGKNSNNESVVTKLRRSLDNLSSKMKNFDLEIINWIGYDNEIKDKPTLDYHKRIFEVLNEENEIIKYCREIKKVLLGDVDQRSEIPENDKNSKTIEVEEPERPSSEITSSKPNYEKDADLNILDTDISVHKDVTADKEKDSSTFLAPSNSSHLKDNRLKKLDSRNESNTNRTAFTDRPEASTSKSVQKESCNPQMDHTDDDDAISLYAESITCLETSKRSSLNANNSIDTIDQQSRNNSKEIQNSRANDRFDPTNDDYDDFESRGCDSPPNNDIYEDRFGRSNLYNKTPDRIMFNKSNAVEKSLATSSNIPNKFNTTSTPKTNYNALDEFMRKFETFKSNHASQLNTSNSLASRFAELKNLQVRVPVNSEAGSRRFEIIENTDNNINSSSNNTEKVVRLQEKDKLLTNGPEARNSHDVTNSVEKTLENSTNEQFKPQSPITKKHFQNRDSLVFNGCIFNLVSSCKKKNNCHFPHVNIEPDNVTAMLKDLNQQQFLRECAYISAWYILLPKYGLCFVKECVRRKLTNMLLRITVDFITKVKNQKNIVVQASETTLLYLNDVDLKPCYDILQSVATRELLLCDYLMKVISETQNFSRFKSVFIKLTIFMCEIGRTFDLEVASQLLERVSILGYDDILAAALIQIVEKTDCQIFAASMMSSFERKLSANNLELYEQLIELKMAAGMGSALSPQRSPCLAANVTQSTPIGRVESPATSKESTSKNSDPIITRTVRVNHANHANLASSDSSEEVMKHPARGAKARWRGPRPPLLRSPRLPHWHPQRTFTAHRPPYCRQPPPGC